MIKKLICVFITTVLLLSCAAAATSTQSMTITVESIKVNAKTDTATVQILIADNPGIALIGFDVDYDTDAMKLTAATAGDIFNDAINCNLEKTPFSYTAYTGAENKTENGALLLLTFKLNSDIAPGVYSISINNAEALNIDEDEINCSVVNGSITVESDAQTDSGSSSSNTATYRGGTIKNPTQPEKTDKSEDKSKNQIILTIGKTEAMVFGKAFSNDVAPIIVHDRTMLPIRFIAESLGATVNWDEANQQVIINNDKTTILITINAEQALVNDQIISLDSPAFIENDRTYVPLRFVVDSLGSTVDWDEKTQTVTITK